MVTSHRIKNLIIKSLQHHGKGYIHQDVGFTLIEVLVVVFLIGILSAIAAPGWAAFASRERVNKANDAVLSVIKQTQSLAKNTKRIYSVSFRVNSSTNVPEYIIYQGVPPTTITTTTIPSSSTTSSSGWTTLGDNLRLQARQVFLYSNLTSLTAYNTTTSTLQINTSTTGTATITFDYLGALANTNISSNGVPTGVPVPPSTPLAIMVSPPLPTGSAASNQDGCVIIQGLIGGIRTAKDANCLTLYTGT